MDTKKCAASPRIFLFVFPSLVHFMMSAEASASPLKLLCHRRIAVDRAVAAVAIELFARRTDACSRLRIMVEVLGLVARSLFGLAAFVVDRVGQRLVFVLPGKAFVAAAHVVVGYQPNAVRAKLVGGTVERCRIMCALRDAEFRGKVTPRPGPKKPGADCFQGNGSSVQFSG